MSSRGVARRRDGRPVRPTGAGLAGRPPALRVQLDELRARPVRPRGRGGIRRSTAAGHAVAAATVFARKPRGSRRLRHVTSTAASAPLMRMITRPAAAVFARKPRGPRRPRYSRRGPGAITRPACEDHLFETASSLPRLGARIDRRGLSAIRVTRPAVEPLPHALKRRWAALAAVEPLHSARSRHHPLQARGADRWGTSSRSRPGRLWWVVWSAGALLRVASSESPPPSRLLRVAAAAVI